MAAALISLPPHKPTELYKHPLLQMGKTEVQTGERAHGEEAAVQVQTLACASTAPTLSCVAADLLVSG